MLFRSDLATLRRRANGSITETLIEAERYLFLDSEVIVNNHSAIGRRYLDQFLDEAGKFQRNGGTLFSFLEWLKIADSEEGGIKFSNVSVTNEAVQILTIHAAKGLEWKAVFVVGLSEGLLPISHATKASEFAEERRLFYVAVTRAQESLTLSWAHSRHNDSKGYREKSTLLRDLVIN